MVSSALLFGHSQTGGMGVDLADALKSFGVKVTRIVHNGYNDKKLLAAAPDVGAAGLTADKVFLYAGGNSDVPDVPALLALIDYFGAERTTVILPPVNTARDPAKVAAQRAKNAGNYAGIKDTVKTYSIEAEGSNFSANTDHVHLRAGSPVSKAFAAQVVDEVVGAGHGDVQIAQGSSWGLLLAFAGLGAVLWLRRRQR